MTTLSDANTPLSPEELADLIPSLSTKRELNEWERENIIRARAWAMRNRTPATAIASEEYVRRLHTKMFDQTWKWAGVYRRTEKNLGVPCQEIRDGLAALLGDVRYWMRNGTYEVDEIAVRLHYRLVVIHPFPNGNGRHARLIADVLATKLGRPSLSWGSVSLIAAGEARKHYLASLRTADAGDIKPLLEFSRS
jgi:Fic-DOC domain mobile mystery protein B